MTARGEGGAEQGEKEDIPLPVRVKPRSFLAENCKVQGEENISSEPQGATEDLRDKKTMCCIDPGDRQPEKCDQRTKKNVAQEGQGNSEIEVMLP